MNASRLAVPANLRGLAYLRARIGGRFIPTEWNDIPRWIALVGLMVLAPLPVVDAGGVRVSWAANPEPDIETYQVLYGTRPGSYGGVVETGLETSATITDLTAGTTYYFALKAVSTAGLESDPSTEVAFTIPGTPPPEPRLAPRQGWKVTGVSSEQSADMAATCAFDGDPGTMWHTAWSPASVNLPHWFEVDMGAATGIRGFRYQPRDLGFTVGNIAGYEFLTSGNGTTWTTAAAGTFPNTAGEKEVLFEARTARFFRFRALSEVSGLAYTSVPEFNLILADGEEPPVEPPVTNSPPVASPAGVSTLEDQALSITLAATDVDGDPLTYVVVSNPSKGTLSGSPPNLTYTPNANANGADSFTFRANDGSANSNVATVSITVTPVNDAPVATGKSVTTAEDTPVGIVLTATDVDGDPLTYSVVSSPSKGTLSGSPPNLTYTPNANANGADSFTFRANDGTANSNVATVSIAITPVNDAPVAAGKSVTTAEDTPVGIVLTATDVDGDPLTYVVVSNPSKGTLSGSPPNLTYTPNANANGADSFTFRANDGSANSNVATVSITVTPVNDAPVATGKSVTTPKDTPVSITLTAHDVEGSPLTFRILAQPANGTLTGSAPDLLYAPSPGFTGSDSFTFAANDGELDSATATVSITVQPEHSPQDDFVLDRAGWSIASVDSQEAPNWAAAKAIDGNRSSFWHTRFTSGSTPPPHEIVVDLGDSRIVHGFRYLPRQDALTVGNIADFEFHTSVDGETWSAAAAGRFAADAYEKETLFTARAARFVRLRGLSEVSGYAHSNVAELNVLGIAGANSKPEAKALAGTTASGGPIVIALAGSDPDMQPLDFLVVKKPRHGTLGGSGAVLVYHPAPGFNGQDSFTYRVSDGLASSEPATVTLSVAGSVLPPKFRSTPIVGAAGTAGAAYSGPSLRSALATTGSGKQVTFRKVAGPSWLSVSANGSLTGKAPATAGTQRFVVRVTNSDGVSAESPLLINLNPAKRDILPPGWESDAPGGAKGSAKQAKGTTTVSGTGKLAGRSDAGYFASKELRGNGSITVRLGGVGGAGSLARAGVMIRGSERADAPHVFLGTNGNGSLRIARRSQTGGATAEKASGAKPDKTIWLRLRRTGDRIDAFTSENGRKWTKAGTYKVKLGTTCRIGLWVSGGGKATGKATFQKLKIQS